MEILTPPLSIPKCVAKRSTPIRFGFELGKRWIGRELGYELESGLAAGTGEFWRETIGLHRGTGGY
ncbi:hypothetical protein [Sporosarcina sp. ZBG7A]|uniref:hypothetical protein n=1 Tax=Sporosarcina sp. ZBG7A TaxID=1582223 RepID=UPI000A97E644|nr:hypothetical protein [Sporosarcina sp. ZBG7A]